MFKSGEIVLAEIQFVDSFEIKKRPALILFEEYENYIVAGITSNQNMKGVKLEKSKDLIKNSVIKLNYIFTISKYMIIKKITELDEIKKKEVYNELNKKLKEILN